MNPYFILFFFVTLFPSKAHSTPQPRICQIGAGISSATIAHFLTENALQPAPDITIFERAAQPGGRVHTTHLVHPRLDQTIPVEAGASIIADDNLLMSHFTKLLNLTRKQPTDAPAGFWTGSRFVLRTGSYQIVDIATVLLRYHISFFRQRRFVKSLLTRFKQLYPRSINPSSPLTEWRPHSNVSSLLNHTSLFPLTQLGFVQQIADFTQRHKDELVAAITRVNYGQDPHQMNALSGSVALAGSGSALWKVREGNVRVIEGLLQRAQVDIHLNTQVTSVEKTADASYILHTKDQEWNCDAVVLAAPFELCNISLPESIAARAHVGREFQQTHATFLAGVLNHHTFGADPPDQILTVTGSTEKFTSIGIAWRGEGEVPSVYKVFSKMQLSQETLERMFLPGVQVLVQFPWLAYPKFNPPERFAPFDLDPDGAFFYTSPLESAGSAMEMSAVSGANVAALLKERLQLKPHYEQSTDEKEEL